MPSFYYRPVIPLTLASMAGIAIGSVAPGCEAWAAVIAAGCGLAAFLSGRRRKAAGLSPLLLFAALGYLSLQPWVHPRFPENHVSRYLNTGPWEIVGRIETRPLESENRAIFVLAVERLKGDGGERPLRGLLRVSVFGHGPELSQGDRVVLRSRIRPIRNFNNPGGFDFKSQMHYAGIWGGAAVSGDRLQVIAAPPAAGPAAAVDAARSAIARLVDAAVPGTAAPVLKALVIGERSGIAPETRLAFTRAGVAHVLAISGLHVGIVASVAFFLLRWLLGRIPPILENGWARKAAALLAIIPVLLYALIAGMSPSTQRALIMAAVFLLALLVEREFDLMNTLAAAALVILTVHPPALFAISFQLSFAAVFSIVYGLSVFQRRIFRQQPAAGPATGARIRRWLAVFFLVSFCATWGTLPLVMRYFNTVSFIGLPANAVVIPWIGYGVVPLGLAGALMAPLSAAAAMACFKAAGAVLAPAIALVEWMAGLPYAAAYSVTPSALEMACFYILSAALAVLIRRRLAAAAARPAPQSRPLNPAAPGPSRKAVGALLAVTLLVAMGDAGYWLYQRWWCRDLRVTWVDVGQGNAVLIEFPAGVTMLVDGGGMGDNSAFDVGRSVVAPLLWQKKIMTVDTLVLSHPNSDHLNGLIFIAKNFGVHTLWTNGEAADTLGYRQLMQAAAEQGIRRPPYAALPRRSMVNGVDVELLYPPVDFPARMETERWRNENNSSLVLRLAFGTISFLFPGDIMRRAEKELLRLTGERLQSTVLTVPHHGSRSASSEEFVAAVAPRTAVVSCADREAAGLPHAEVLARYRGHGARILRTDRNGAVRITTNGLNLQIDSQLD
jgi:competence protein ComEC